MEYFSLSYDFYNGLSGFKILYLKNGDSVLVYFDKTEDLDGNGDSINFKHIINKSEFISDKSKGFVFKRICLSDITSFGKDEYVHPYLR